MEEKNDEHIASALDATYNAYLSDVNASGYFYWGSFLAVV
jgi:hypothetical protein